MVIVLYVVIVMMILFVITIILSVLVKGSSMILSRGLQSVFRAWGVYNGALGLGVREGDRRLCS